MFDTAIPIKIQVDKKNIFIKNLEYYFNYKLKIKNLYVYPVLKLNLYIQYKKIFII